MKYLLPLYRWENWGSEKLNNFIKVTGQYLRNGGVKADLLDSRAQACVEKLQGKVPVSPVRCLTDEKVPLSDRWNLFYFRGALWLNFFLSKNKNNNTKQKQNQQQNKNKPCCPFAKKIAVTLGSEPMAHKGGSTSSRGRSRWPQRSEAH